MTMKQRSTNVVSALKKQPKPHQDQALSPVLRALISSNRATVAMACGTGKTLLGMWTAERLNARRILILVPSLGLISQTLNEWHAQTSFSRSRWLCVCSDGSVSTAVDHLPLEMIEPDVPVTTDASAIREFYGRRESSVAIIIATYQSARIVSRATKSMRPFDLVIFDEAHKTAGRKGKAFAWCLDDKNLTARRRLFMTATPRHCRPGRKGRAEEALVHSMDDVSQYGQVAYKLSFGEAARRKLVCPYKVIVCEVTKKEIDQEMIRNSKVAVNGSSVHALHVAGQIALRKACKKHKVQKIITFHERVKHAALFCSKGSWGIHNHLPGFQVFHVSGYMKALERQIAMARFEEAPQALISNARCLTEGIDIPAIDMVAFFCRKKSVVEVAQATGRAMRRSPGKRIGYILLPVIIDRRQGQSIETAIAQADYGHVWEVLQALKDQDDVLCDILTKWRRRKGVAGGHDIADQTFGDRVQVIGRRLTLSRLREAIATQAVDFLTPIWEERYGQLVTFKAKYGHCNVPTSMNALGKWVQHQRSLKSHGLLHNERILKLDAIGFSWNLYQEVWDSRFLELKAFWKAHGHCHVPRKGAWHGLYRWVGNQRHRHSVGRLDPSRKESLDGLGMWWDTFWHRRSKAIEDYYKRYGTFDFEKSKILKTYARFLRAQWKRGELSKDRRTFLENIGFPFTIAYDLSWTQRYRQLLEFRKRHGHCLVTKKMVPYRGLYFWLMGQLRQKRTGNLSSQRIRKLDAAGVVEDREEQRWKALYSRLVAFKAEHGDCNVPQNFKKDHSLGLWASHQRKLKRMGMLPVERKKKLDKLGFVWKRCRSNYTSVGRATTDARWNRQYAKLLTFKRENGNCRVTAKCPDARLLAWVKNQRSFERTGRLLESRMTILNRIGFTWSKRRGR